MRSLRAASRRDSRPITVSIRPMAVGTLPQDQGARTWLAGPGHQAAAAAAAAAARPPAGRTSCADLINAIKGNRPPAGAGSRGILRQLSATDQAPGAGHQGPGTSRTGSGISTQAPGTTDQGPKSSGQVSGRPGHQLQGSHQNQGNPRRPWARTSSATRAPAWCTAGNKKPGQVAGFGLQLQQVTSRRVRQPGPVATLSNHIAAARRHTVAPGCSPAKRCPGRNRRQFASPGR